MRKLAVMHDVVLDIQSFASSLAALQKNCLAKPSHDPFVYEEDDTGDVCHDASGHVAARLLLIRQLQTIDTDDVCVDGRLPGMGLRVLSTDTCHDRLLNLGFTDRRVA